VQLRAQPEQDEAILTTGVVQIRQEQAVLVVEDSCGLSESDTVLPLAGEILGLVPLEPKWQRTYTVPTMPSKVKLWLSTHNAGVSGRRGRREGPGWRAVGHHQRRDDSVWLVEPVAMTQPHGLNPIFRFGDAGGGAASSLMARTKTRICSSWSVRRRSG